MNKIVLICLILVAIKSILGWHWPWEKCSCCGKKWSEHRRIE